MPVILLLGAFASIAAGIANIAFAPHWLAPASLALIVPALMLGSFLGDLSLTYVKWHALVVVLGIYLIIVAPLLLQSGIAQVWSWATFVVITVSNVAYILFRIGDGILVQGEGYVWAVVGLNVLALIFAFALFAHADKVQERLPRIMGGIALTVWTVWVAFPWFGEML